jgi:hypothetical protein
VTAGPGDERDEDRAIRRTLKEAKADVSLWQRKAQGENESNVERRALEIGRHETMRCTVLRFVTIERHAWRRFLATDHRESHEGGRT